MLQMLLYIHIFLILLCAQHDHFSLKAATYLCTFDNVIDLYAKEKQKLTISNQLNYVIDDFAANYSLDNYR